MLLGKISGDPHGQGSPSFSCAIGTDILHDEDRNAGEKLSLPASRDVVALAITLVPVGK